MSEIIFTELRQFNTTTNRIFAIKKFNGLIFFSTNRTAAGEVWTYNPITRVFLLNSTFAGGESIRDFIISSSSATALIGANKLFAVQGGTDGKLFSYDNDGTWTAEVGTGDPVINSIVEYKGDFYMGTDGDQVYKWNGSGLILSLTAAETGGDINTLFVHNDLLFAGTATSPQIFVFDGSSWSLEDTLSDTGVVEILCFEEFNSELYCGTDKTTTGNNLWKRDDSVSPVNWVTVTSLSNATDIETLEVFFDKLYIGTRADDSILRYDGTNFVTIKSAVDDIAGYSQNASFADGSDCLYFGSTSVFAQNPPASLFEISPRCSDELLISEASPFGWNVGDCDITPEICLIEDGCFCQIANTGDTTIIQIQFNGAGTPHLAISDITTGIESSITAFTNTVGIIWEVTIDLTGLNCENIQLIVTTRTGTDEGEWVDIEIGGIIDLGDVHVGSLTRIYVCGTNLNALLKRSNNSGDSFSDKTVPSTGSQGVAAMSMKGASAGTIMVARSNGFGYSIDGLDSYVNDTNHAVGGPVAMRALSAETALVINKAGGASTLTADNGATWTGLGFDPTAGVTDCDLTTSLIFFATQGTAQTIEKTTDGGATAWAIIHSASENLNSIFMISSTVGICVGNNGTILKTTDGSTWVAKTSGTSENLNGVWFANSLIGWTVGENSIILKTIDGAETWVVQTSPISANFNAVDGFLSGSSIFVVAVGDVGKVIRLNSATALTGVDFAVTECIKVKNDSQCGLLIKYTNDANFADFDYTNGLINQIRIEAHFWKVENPVEKSIHVTSSEEVIPLRQVVKRQVMLETGIMPEYMHEKLSIIFSHAAIEIEGITYVAEEGYEHDPFANNFRQAKGHVLLTDKTYTKENIF